MNSFLPEAASFISLLLTYLLHSTVLIGIAAWLTYRLRNSKRPEIRLLIWKAVLILPLATTIGLSTWALPHFGWQLSLTDSHQPRVTTNDNEISPHLPVETAHWSPQLDRSQFPTEIESNPVPFVETEPSTAETLFRPANPGLWVVVTIIAIGGSSLSFIRLIVQTIRLRHLRRRGSVTRDPVLIGSLERIATQMRLSRSVDLLESPEIDGPITAGVFRPFIMLPLNMKEKDDIDHEDETRTPQAELDAVLAHELAHIKQGDAIWIMISRIMICLCPFQPLHRWVARQLLKEMDFVADLQAIRTLQESSGLIHSLIRLGQQMSCGECNRTVKTGLVAGMVAFRSTLATRVEILLNETGEYAPATRSLQSQLLIVMTVGAILLSSCLPKAVSQTPQTRNSLMKHPIMTLAVLVGLTAPQNSEAIEEPVAKVEKSVELKTSPDPLPEGIHNFNGMLVGRLAAKDVEKGTFVAYVDAVPRVWRNSRAENPKSIVGKTIEISGVFGKFLDVLVVTRTGETIEFECKYDGGNLVFPGELLRKVAPYKAEDYPELPEGFRGFRGVLDGEIVKKDPNTFELILKVNKVLETGDESASKNPESIEGKHLMLAGFWNKKELYHSLKEKSRVRVGVRHISRRSDHLDVTSVTRIEKPLSSRLDGNKMEREEGEMKAGMLPRELRGFRGMLVGKLVKKDIERGTFTIEVDAVPRVWNNNRASNPKAYIGKQAHAEGVHSQLLDALIVTRVGETLEFGALEDEEGRLRVGEVLRKVAPVKEGDYPELPSGFRGYKGMLTGKITQKDDHLKAVMIEVQSIDQPFEGNRAKDAETIVGKRATLAGFWKRQEAFNGLSVGDTIRCGVEHPQLLSDHLSVIESVRKVDE
ncbi:MAG: M56 family metallopeptidase [Planctomycetaceae bacterium]|nr:M56 family metallopeptidase [Planctomycetaceae bacterium]